MWVSSGGCGQREGLDFKNVLVRGETLDPSQVTLRMAGIFAVVTENITSEAYNFATIRNKFIKFGRDDNLVSR
jgi:hypothetical protein